MRWFQSIASSSGIGSGGGDSPRIGGGRLRQGRPKLTRQRKLRHLTDQDIAGVSNLNNQFEPDPGADSDISSFDRTTIDGPVPLPLPDFTRVSHHRTQSPDGDLPLPSPKEVGPSRNLERKDRGDGFAEGTSNNAGIGSALAIKDHKRVMEHVEERSYRLVFKAPISARSSRDNFRINIPVRSAPSSPYLSPVLSPHRRSAVDIYHIPKGGMHDWDLPEVSLTNMISGYTPPASIGFKAYSADSSLLHSPPGNHPCGSAPPLHPKLSAEPSTSQGENNAQLMAHPLPLPPGATMPSPRASIRQVSVKQEPFPAQQWQKGKLIGRGTFGSVYAATNRETGALCAMKEVELCPDDPKSAECMKQLEQEIKVLSKLKHPNIVQYYGSEIAEDRFYIYLEYVYPGSINKYIREHCGAITESVVRNFTRHILSGLSYLHSTKTIHRDIKGANLLVDAFGVVKLADFGMAKHLSGQAAELSLKGSPYWMAPELMQAVMQKDNKSDLALAVDIWSLGCTIIEMLNGKPPWSEYEGPAAMFKVLRDIPPIPETLSSEGKDFLHCCFQRNPAERPTSAMLLEHQFVKNSQQLDSPCQASSFNGMKRTQNSQSLREKSEDKLDQFPVFPSTRGLKAKTFLDGFMHYSFSSVSPANNQFIKLPT